MRIVLIRNYLPDKQESMKRFADMLESGFKQSGIAVVNQYPVIAFGKITGTTLKGLGKWLGYIDKWILFPFIIKWRLVKKSGREPNTFFHICDHSNAPYLPYLPKDRTGITCHDVLAIRGALGFADAYCPASSFGTILQKWILKNLIKANYIACVSHLTYHQLTELAPNANHKERKWTVIHNGFNADFVPMPDPISLSLLSAVHANLSTPYILHVGSGLPRKNRKLLVDMIDLLADQWNGNICFAGDEIEDSLQLYIAKKKLINRVISVVKPDHKTLNALYSHCKAFVFPSFSEGFGWPVIEAQACGVPVIASNIEPMPEVSSGTLHADPYHVGSFADAFLLLQNETKRKQIIAAGYENVKRFAPGIMIQKYIHLYQSKPVLSDVS